MAKPVLYDLKKCSCPELSDLLYQEMNAIQHRDDRLKDNYSWENLNWDDFLSFTVLYDREAKAIIGFSGLQYGRWGPNLARAASRLYISPSYRGGTVPCNWYNTWMMPFQIKHAPNYIEACFWSREKPNNRNISFIAEQATKYCRYGFKHEVMPGVYNVCRPIPYSGAVNTNKSCWQKIALIRLNLDFQLNLPCISLDEYNELYS